MFKAMPMVSAVALAAALGACSVTTATPPVTPTAVTSFVDEVQTIAKATCDQGRQFRYPQDQRPLTAQRPKHTALAAAANDNICTKWFADAATPASGNP